LEKHGENWTQKDSAAALAWIAVLPEEYCQSENISHFVRGWALKDPDAAIKWTEEIPDEEIRENSLHKAIIAWGENAPREALQRALELTGHKGRCHL